MNLPIHGVEILGEQTSISLIEILSYSRCERLFVVEMVEAGLLEPSGQPEEQWQFTARDLRRLRAAQRLVSDLGVNVASAALILDLIEERDALLIRVAMLQRLIDDE